MPDSLVALSPEQRKRTAQALTQFLLAQQSDSIRDAPSLLGDSNRGRKLYHEVGCVACHAPRDNYQPTVDGASIEVPPMTVPSIPLDNLDSKYRPLELARVLVDPLAVRPPGRRAGAT